MGDYINVVETFETKGIELTVFTRFHFQYELRLRADLDSVGCLEFGCFSRVNKRLSCRRGTARRAEPIHTDRQTDTVL